MLYKIFTGFILSFLVALPIRAETITHALAMHGAPKYGAEFSHFDYVNPDAPKSGRLRLAGQGSFDNLNQLIIMGKMADGLDLTVDRLMQRVWDEPFTLYGWVAESIEIPKDRSRITFYLRPQARFHDGHPMTADDVIFSYEMYRKHGHPVRRRVYGLVDRVEKLNDHAVRFVFGEGHDAETALILAMMPVLPAHYWQDKDISKTTLEPPLGSGPYRIARVDPGRQIVYERVQDYWAKDLPVTVGQYNFDQVSYQYFRDDGIALQSFKGGGYDLRREWDVKKWETAYDHPAVDQGKILLEEIEHGRPEWLRALVFNTRRPLFSDPRVREALGYAFDFEWLNKALFHGQFKRIESTFPNSELAASGAPVGEELRVLESWRDHVRPEVFGSAWQAPRTDGSGPRGLRENLRRASDLLEQAGWKFQNGSLVDAQGRAFSFEILLDDPSVEKVALEYARTLRRLGINARVRTVDSSQFTGRLNDFDYDMVVFRWVNSLSPGNEQMNYWGSKAAANKGSRNYAGVSDLVVDALADSIARADTREELVARARALDRVLMWGHYFIPLYYQGVDRVAYDSGLKRPKVTPVYGVVTETWWREP